MPVPDEHGQRFLTYKNYVGAIALELQDTWGDATGAFARTFDATLARCGKIQSVPAPMKVVFPSLARGWSHLLALWRDTEEEFYEEANAWTPGKAWYAVHHGLGALLPFIAPQEVNKDRTHEQTLRLLRQIVVQRKLLPHPFNLYVTGYGADTAYDGFSQPPKPINTLTSPYNASYEDYAGMFLRRTADQRSERVIRAWQRETRRRKRHGEIPA